MVQAPRPGAMSQASRLKNHGLVQPLIKKENATTAENAGTKKFKLLYMENIKTRYTFVYRSRDGHYMRPESFLNINKGRTLSSSQLRLLGITKVKLKDARI
jgi:hypothetical protein